jgi:hypothetical protein
MNGGLPVQSLLIYKTIFDLLKKLPHNNPVFGGKDAAQRPHSGKPEQRCLSGVNANPQRKYFNKAPAFRKYDNLSHDGRFHKLAGHCTQCR